MAAPPQPQFTLAYEEPFWSALPPKDCAWSLEVIRNGVQLPSVSLADKPCFLIGRLPVCDIVLDNDTASRQHAVLQQRANGKLYLFDLGSTHGSFIHKQRVEPKTYIELKAGMHLKFGTSARLYIVCGGPPEETPENDDDEKDGKAETTTDTTQEGQETQPKKAKKGAGDVFVGSVEDAEKFVRQVEHQERQKERAKRKKKEQDKKKRRETGGAGDDDDDDDDEAELKKQLKGKRSRVKGLLGDIIGDDDGGSSSDGEKSLGNDDVEGGPDVEGEADPDKMVVGGARSNWEDFDADIEDDDLYNEAGGNKRAAKKDSGKALSRNQIIDLMAENDMKIRNLESQIAAVQASSDAKKAPDAEDDLDAFMDQIADKTKQEQVQKIQRQVDELNNEKKRLQKLLDAATTAVDRIAAEKKATSLKDRMAAAAAAAAAAEAASKTKAEATTFAMPAPKFAKPALPAKPAAAAAPIPVEDSVLSAPAAVAKPKAAVSGTAALMKELAKADAHQQQAAAAQPKPQKPQQQYVARDPDQDGDVEWVPPTNQRGDGMTDLNKKLGY